MKRRNIGIGVLALTSVLFFCFGAFVSLWNPLSAQIPPGAIPSGALPSNGGVPMNSGMPKNSGSVPNTEVPMNYGTPPGGAGNYPRPANAEANIVSVVGGQPVNLARPLEVPPIYAFDSMIDSTCQQIVVVDSKTKRICVYHIRQNGTKCTVELVGARNFEWDLKLDNFNGAGLLPIQIREQVWQSGNKP